MSSGVEGRLRAPLRQRADFSDLLPSGWSALSAADLARRPVYLEQDGPQQFGDLFELTGEPGETIRLSGSLGFADRLGARLSEGIVVVEGNVGDEAGVEMSGGVLDIHGNAGDRTGAARPGSKRGMLGGELIVRGSTGSEAGSFMRRGLLAVLRRSGERTGLGMIAGNVILLGDAAAGAGLWSKRGSIVALSAIAPPATYSYACTYRPIHLRLMLGRLRAVHNLPIRRQHIHGQFRRFSGDFAESGKGEILQWTGT